MKSTIGPLIGREWYRIAIVACTTLPASCTSTQPPVPIEAADPSLSSLAGNWAGEGSIVFNLKAGDKSATGDVVMCSTAGIVRVSRLANREARITKEISGKLDSSSGSVTPQRGRWKVNRQ